MLLYLYGHRFAYVTSLKIINGTYFDYCCLHPYNSKLLLEHKFISQYCKCKAPVFVTMEMEWNMLDDSDT